MSQLQKNHNKKIDPMYFPYSCFYQTRILNQTKQTEKNEIKLSKITNCRSKPNTKKSNIKENSAQQKNQFQDVTTKPTTYKQTNA